jgi:hypothetical protein
MSAGCAQARGLPWLAPCCSGCASSRARAAGDLAITTNPNTAGVDGYGALLVLGGIAIAVLYGEKVLRGLGG